MKINKHAIARILLCLMLTFTMVAPMAMPSEVYAAKSTTSSSSVVKSKTQQISGMKMVFKGKVMSDARLNFAPGNLTVTGKRKSIKLTWARSRILRRSPAITYSEEMATEPGVI